jgi:ATP-dependent Lon protease
MHPSGLIPLFPLGLVLYPNELLPLHIFEPRYREMIRECIDMDQPFGIVFIEDGRMARIGCTARVREVVRRYEDDRMDIVVSGESRFRIVDVLRQRAFLQADAEPVPEPNPDSDTSERERAITQHMKLLELAGREPSPSAYEQRTPLSYFIALNVGLSIQQKQAMLEMPDEQSRINFLVQHMSEFIPRVEQAESLKRKITSNGHFPDFPL